LTLRIAFSLNSIFNLIRHTGFFDGGDWFRRDGLKLRLRAEDAWLAS